ncbi:MAG TPA: Gfo/Idh/MocA family oxidoreductase [Acidothermaceae bacterium]
MGDLNVAIIGYGIGGAVFHGPLVEATPGMRVAYVVTGNEERAAMAQRAHAGVSVVRAADELWSHADSIDLVVVTSPNREHAPQALAAIEAGIPVVVDKPFAIGAAQAEQLMAAASAAEVPLTVFQNRRWDGDFLTVRRLIDEGALGDVTRFESRFERWRPMLKTGWREIGGPGEAGGLLFDLGAHLIDQAMLLFGPVEQVYAQVDTRRPGALNDDDTFVALTHTGGVRSHLWVSAVASDVAARMRVLGSRAAYVKYGLDVQEDRLRDGRRPDLEADWGAEPESMWGLLGTPGDSSPVATEPGCYQRFYAEVAAALRGEGALPVDPADSVRGLRVIEAAQRSHRDGVVVRL